MSDKVSDWDDNKQKKKSEKSDDYNDNWDMSASYNELLEEKGNKKEEVQKKTNQNTTPGHVNFDNSSKPRDDEPPMKIDFFGTENDHSNKKPQQEIDDFGDANLFENELEDLENEFKDEKFANPFGKSSTKELLAQSRKEIYEDDLKNSGP